MFRALNILLFLCLCILGSAQEPLEVKGKPQPYLQLNYHTGSFWSRSEFLVEQFSDPYKAVEARLGFQLTGTKMWQQLHNYPKLGLGMHYSDLVKDRSDTIVGNPFSLFAFYSAPWARAGRFTLNTDMSIGLSYTGMIYDSIHDLRIFKVNHAAAHGHIKLLMPVYGYGIGEFYPFKKMAVFFRHQGRTSPGRIDMKMN